MGSVLLIDEIDSVAPVASSATVVLLTSPRVAPDVLVTPPRHRRPGDMEGLSLPAQIRPYPEDSARAKIPQHLGLAVR
jgi:hypothetical protein